MIQPELLCLFMFIAACGFLIMGYPVAFTLGGTAILFAYIGAALGVFDLTLLTAFPQRIFSTMTNDVLVAVPLFVFMGVMLERSRVAEELLDNMGRALGAGVTGGIGIQCGGDMMEYVLTGTMWFKVPETQKYIIEGKAPKGVYPRDVIQYIIGEVGMDNSVYKAIEWDGSYIHSQPVPLRYPFTMMSVEIGAKTAFIEPDEIILEYIKDRVKVPYEIIKTDPDAKIEAEFRFDVSNLTPQVAAPENPGNTKPIAEEIGNPIHQVCIGTCCGSSIYDMRTAAEVLKGHQVKARTNIVPGTREVLSQCAAEGLLQVFADCGADMMPAHCGTCQTISCSHLAPGETQMHPGPRNWTGRTAEGSYAYLASPATCAASAIEGQVADCRNYL